MAFRDDNEARRARAEQLEAQLASAHRTIASQAALIDALRDTNNVLQEGDRARKQALARVAELQAKGNKPETSGQRARREKAERRAKQRAERHAATSPQPYSLELREGSEAVPDSVQGNVVIPMIAPL